MSTCTLVKPSSSRGALSPAPWLPVCSMVAQYASQIPSSRQTQPVLQCQVQHLLGRAYGRWKSKSPALGCRAGPSVAEIPWDDIIALCVHHKLRDWTPPRLPVTSGSECLALWGRLPGRPHWSSQPRERFTRASVLSCGSPSSLSLGLPFQASDFQVTCQCWGELRRL